MSDVLLGVIIGSLIALAGQIIAQIFQIKGTKWKKYQERLDLIFKERMEAYKVMNTKLYALEEAVSKNQIFDQVHKNFAAAWTEMSVYLPPKVSKKILVVINNSSIMQTGPNSNDRQRYMESLKQAKVALQDLEDINWLPHFE